MVTTSVLGAMQAYRKQAIDDGDQTWDRAEVAQLTKLAAPGDTFTTEGVKVLLDEINSPVAFEAGAKKDLFDILVHQAKIDPRKITAEPPPVTLAVQEGGSNKFYALEIEGATVRSRWGKIGSSGQSKEESFATPELARKAFMSTLRGKLSKGYAAVTPESIGVAAASPKQGGLDAAKFKKLDPEAQLEILEWSHAAEQAGLKSTGEVRIDQLEDPKHVAFAKQMRAEAADATSDFEIHDDEYLVVGAPRVNVEIFTFANGEIAGGTIWVFQKGVEQPEDYWDNEEAYDEAKLEKLADQTDVSWSAHGVYGRKDDDEIVPLRTPDYMEWSGY